MKKIWPSGAGIWTPDFQQFSWKVRETRSNQTKLLKEIGLYFTFSFKKLFCAVRPCSPGSRELWTWLNNPSKKLKKDFAVFIRDQKKRKGMKEVYNEGKNTMNQVFFPGPGSLNHVPSRCFPAILIRFLEIKDISRCRYHLDERFRALSHLTLHGSLG